MAFMGVNSTSPTAPGSATHESTLFGSAARAPRHVHFARTAVVGLCAGLLAVGFRRGLALAEAAREDLLAALRDHPAWGWAVLPVVTGCVGCVVGWATQRFAPEAAGSGIPHLKGVLLHLRTLGWARLVPVKFLGGIAGIGAGLSLGREGPTVQIGAAVARALAGPLRTPAADVPQLFSAGAGAGLAAAFNAPLAGLIFVVEELQRELSSRTAGGALIATVCATVVTQWLAGDTPAFEARGLFPLPLSAVPLAIVMGLLGGLGGVVFNRSLLATLGGVQRLDRIPRWSLPGLAGLAVGLAAWWLPGVAGGGHSMAERLLSGGAPASAAFLALLLGTKLLATSISYGSGAPGGIFAPMLLLGALTGAAFIRLVEVAVASPQYQIQAFAVLGMAAFFVGSVRAPLTGIVLISELTGGYQLLFPICVASLVAYLTAEGLRNRPIYEALLEVDLARSGHGRSHPEPRNVYIGVQRGAPLAYLPIAKAGLPRGCLITAVERSGLTLIPSADTVLLPGDHISILAPGDRPEAPLEIVRLCTGL
ncbi:MAG: H(+)/Cl(-) exchange transporter ClcA [Planctomycetes bacterium]|nr:H(+)/Cl(-) exchange transporter ClcA [Planctomycetota bacterium]